MRKYLCWMLGHRWVIRRIFASHEMCIADSNLYCEYCKKDKVVKAWAVKHKIHGVLPWSYPTWLREADVDSVEKLKGIPVEVTFEGNALKEWRILTEVI